MVQFPSNSTELLEEDLLGVLGSLGLDVAKHLAPLLEVEIGPVAHVHPEDVLLAELHLR